MKRIAGGKKNKQGIAKVRMGKSLVEVTFADDKANPYKISRDECPPYIDSVKPGEWFVVLNGDDDRIAGIRPVRAMAKAKFVRFAAKENEVPAPKQMPGGVGTRKDGSTFPYESYLAFTSILVLCNEEYKGMEVPVFMRYLFADDGDGYACIKGGGKNADLLEGFLDVTGAMNIDIKFSDNLLPKLQKTMLQHNETFGVTIQDGFVTEFYDLPEEDGDLDDADEVDDEPFEADEPEDDLDDDDSPIEELEEDEEAVL